MNHTMKRYLFCQDSDIKVYHEMSGYLMGSRVPLSGACSIALFKTVVLILWGFTFTKPISFLL